MSAIDAALAAYNRNLEPVAPCSLRLAGTVDVKSGYGKMYRGPFGGKIAKAMRAGKLTGIDGWVYACICAHAAGGSGIAWPGRKRIAEGVGCALSTVSRSVGRLEAVGLIRVDRSHNRVNRYHVLGAVGGCSAGAQVVARGRLGSSTPAPRKEQVTDQVTLSLWRERINPSLHRFAASELSDTALDELVEEHGAGRLEAALRRQIELGDDRPKIKYSTHKWYHARCREAPEAGND